MTRLAINLCVLFSLTLIACGPDPDPDPQPKQQDEKPLFWEEASTMNAHAVLLMDQTKMGEAIPVFEELERRTPDLYETRFNLAVGYLNAQNNVPAERIKELERAEAIFRELIAESPDRTHAHYCLSILLEHLGKDREGVRAALEKSLELAPESADVAYRLGKHFFEEGGEHLPRAAELLTQALEKEQHFASAWNTLFGTLRRLKEKERAQEAMRMFQLYSDTKPDQGKKLQLIYNGMGELACCFRDLPRYGKAAQQGQTTIALRMQGAPVSKGSIPPPRALGTFNFGPPSIHDLDADGNVDLFVPLGFGKAARLFEWNGEDFVDVTSDWGFASPIKNVYESVVADVNHDSKPDLIAATNTKVRIYCQGEGQFREIDDDRRKSLQIWTGVQVVDVDHDGDLDVYAQTRTDAAPTLLKNLRPTIYEADTKPSSPFKECGELLSHETKLGRSASVWIDVDRDGDVDLVELRNHELHFWLNQRLMRFKRVEGPKLSAAGEVPLPKSLSDLVPSELVTADLNQDGLPDFVASSNSQATVFQVINRGGLGFEVSEFISTDDLPPMPELHPVDLDNDGDPDLLVIGIDGSSAVLRNDVGSYTKIDGPTVPSRAVCFHDLDGDGLLDAIFADPKTGEPRWAKNTTKGAGNSIQIALRGKRGKGMNDLWSTRFGTGAHVEVSAKGHRAMIDVMTRNGTAGGTGPFIHLGLGEHENADTVRVIWPDYVIQAEPDTGERPLEIVEVNRKASSCPVLFVPNAEGGFDFVTDFLGVGGLGFFMRPDTYAQPDRDETVRIGNLLPRDGHYEIRVHEPMEEISYLDSFRLLAVDHPVGTEAQCDERLATADPKPTGKPLVFGKAHLPTAAETAKGNDCLAVLLEEDRVYAGDFVKDPRFIGYLAEEQHIAMNFDAEVIAKDRPSAEARLWLFLDGWVEYPYSHVNYAAWQAGVTGSALSVDVGDGEDGWKEIHAELGYPAGMTRCMGADVTAAFDAGIARLRLRSNLEIQVDRVRLAWVLPENTMQQHRRAFTKAELRFVGYPEERSPDGKEPKLYDYQRMSPTFEGWKTMGGRYTNHGDVTAALVEADDRMVVMNHGEEVRLRLPVEALPPVPEGMIRTFFLEAVGFCKDMDPYTAFPDTVGPLPSLGLIDYPSGIQTPKTDEAAPRDRVLRGTFR